MKWMWLAIFAAGGLGALARYALAGRVQEASGSGFPWGTMTVNLLGALLFGFVFVVASERNWIGPEMRMILLTGFLGAFTTFSTLAFETTALMRDGQWLLAAANSIGQVGLGLLAVLAGMACARIF